MSAGMLGYLAGHHPSRALLLVQLGDGLDAYIHAGRGSLSRGPWNKCGPHALNRYIFHFSRFKLIFYVLVAVFICYLTLS